MALGAFACGSPGAGDPDAATPPDGAAGFDATPGDGAAADVAAASDAPGDAGAATDAGPPRRVLFIGNSYTYVNDLPATVRALGAATPGAAVEVESVTEGGARLETHWDSTGARDRLAEGGWDAVVLQGQSLEPIYSGEDFIFMGMLFAGAARDVGTRPLWYATWARRAGDPIYAELGTDPPMLSEGLEARYRYIADTYGGFVARVGAAWQIALAELPGVDLFDADGSHPSPAGTLLTACVMLQAITDRAPRVPDPAPLGIAHDTAEALCAIAPRVECIADRSRCGDECFDLTRDRAHCGSCDGDCTALPQFCSAGVCSCNRATFTRTTFTELRTFDPDCVDERAGAACDRAIHLFCAADGCDTSGFGPMFTSDDRTAATCVAADVVPTTFAALQAFVPECGAGTSEDSDACPIAASRACAAMGALGGFGPIVTSDGELLISCIPIDAGVIIRSTYTRLADFNPACDGATVRAGPQCEFAIAVSCRSMGHVTGFGPIASSGDDLDILCVDP
jgi:hypothetical protein